MLPKVSSLAERADPDAAYREYHRVESAAFGDPSDPAAIAAKRPLVDPARWYLAELDGEACGGVGSFPFELTLPGGATVPVSGVSDVGVLPTHRRRGVLRALVERQLDDAAGRGDVAAVLHASEARIYRRFGYGAATRWRQVEIDSRRSEFHEGWPDPGGEYRLVPREDAIEPCSVAHDAARRVHPGGLSRSESWWQLVLGELPLYIGGGRRRMVLVHRDDSGTPDGYAIYEVRQDWSSGQAAHELHVWELVAVSESVELGLWRALLDHDLVATVTGPISVDSVLWDALVDPRQARVKWEQDLLWARILDVPTALSTRAYGAPGGLTLEVVDGLRPAEGGTFEVEAAGTQASCRRVRGGAELRVDVADLGACWLGGGSFRRLVRAGRVAELAEGAAARADAMFRTDPMPWCWVRF